jgi:predicted metallo-beta-lactamase superfamily hydrolase
MKIKILGTESLGVRGLSCVVEARERKVFIDPGVALGYQRQGLLPHPFQVAVGERVRQQIVSELKGSTDIVISHFHGDHVPLVKANPYQLPAQQVIPYFRNARLWCKNAHFSSPIVAKRRLDLSENLGRSLPEAEGKTDDLLSFSGAVPHGEPNKHLGMVMMTCINDRKDVFVHASDIQLLDSKPISQILDWRPDIVLTSGPPLYLRQMSARKQERVWENAVELSRGVRTLILDHHLLRSEEGFRFLDQISSRTGNRVICAADYMGRRRLPLEAWRQRLYQEMPVAKGWHKAYAAGKADTRNYRNWRGIKIS